MGSTAAEEAKVRRMKKRAAAAAERGSSSSIGIGGGFRTNTKGNAFNDGDVSEAERVMATSSNIDIGVSSGIKPILKRETEAVTTKDREAKSVRIADALKKNFARTMSTVFAEHLIEMIDKKYTKTGKKKRSCPEKLDSWLLSADEVFMEFAEFIVTMKASPDGRKTILSLYKDDTRKTVEAVLTRQRLFDNASEVARGLARFDIHYNLVPSDKLSVLDSSIANESTGSLNTLVKFKEETRELFCYRVKELLNNLSPAVATSVFNDVVKYVQESFPYYSRRGELPGVEFKNLLAEVNIKILEETKASKNFLDSPLMGRLWGDIKAEKDVDEHIRTTINALQKIREAKPISKDFPSNARDVILIRETGGVSKIPVTPIALLQLVTYINALFSLERRNVFTNGFFNAACVLIAQSISSGGVTLSMASSSTDADSMERFPKPSTLASNIAKNSILGLQVIKNANDGSVELKKAASSEAKRPCADRDDSMSAEEHSSGSKSGSESYSSRSSGNERSSEPPPKKKKKKKKVSVKKKQLSKRRGSVDDDDDVYLKGDEDAGMKDLDVFTKIMVKTGGIFYDQSEFGAELRRLVTSKDYAGLTRYASTVIDTRSKAATYRLVSSLIDLTMRQRERIDDLENSSCGSIRDGGKTGSGDGRQQDENVVDMSPLQVSKMLINTYTEQARLTAYFFIKVDPDLVAKHEAFVLTEKLLPSNNNSWVLNVVSSFFRKPSSAEHLTGADLDYVGEKGGGECVVEDYHPDLLRFTRELFKEVSKNIVAVIRSAAEASSAAGGSSSSRTTLEMFQNQFSPAGERINLKGRIKAAVVLEPKEHRPRVVFSPDVAGEGDNSVTGLKLAKLLQFISGSTEAADIRQNAEELTAAEGSGKAAMSIMLFPPPSKIPTVSEDIHLVSSLARGLMSIAEGCVAVVRSREFDGIGLDQKLSSYTLLMDTRTMDDVVTFAANVLENSTAEALSVDKDMRPSQVLEGAFFVEGALSYIVDRRENIPDSVARATACHKMPTALTKYTMMNVTERYLKKLNRNKTLDQNQVASDRALVDQVTNRSTDIVHSQIANAMGVAIVGAAAIKLIEAEAREVEIKTTNNQSTTMEENQGTRANIENRIGMIKNTIHLCVAVAVSVASNITKLSNKHFFDVIKEANAAASKAPPDIVTAASAVGELGNITDDDLSTKTVSKALLTGQTADSAAATIFQGNRYGYGGQNNNRSPEIESIKQRWLTSALDTITKPASNGTTAALTVRNGYGVDLQSHPSPMIFSNDNVAKPRFASRNEAPRETRESILDKLSEMTGPF